MSRNFSPENRLPNPISLGNIKFYPKNLKDFDPKTGLTRISSRELDVNQSVTLPYRPYPLREELPEILQKLHSFKPLCSSGNQRELALKALIALKNRTNEDISNLAKSVADDVADAID